MRLKELFPGVLACAVAAAAATFLSEHYGAPVMLFALLLSMAMNFLCGAGSPCKPGIEFSVCTVLRPAERGDLADRDAAGCPGR